MLAPRIDFTLGACTGVHASAVQALGGWAGLGDQLAEDRELGARLFASGKTLALSHHVLTLEADELTFWAWLKHQHRIAVTYRAATPLGALGMPVLHSFGLALLAAILATLDAGLNGLLVGLVLFAAVFTIRCIAAQSTVRQLAIPEAAIVRCLLVVPFVETFCWLLAWLPLPVWWAGKWRSVGWRGKLE
jgi:cellulose synthase/poly-beta-1,6-N-acetylglucosamine synthase-like glycosyltransferase